MRTLTAAQMMGDEPIPVYPAHWLWGPANGAAVHGPEAFRVGAPGYDPRRELAYDPNYVRDRKEWHAKMREKHLALAEASSDQLLRRIENDTMTPSEAISAFVATNNRAFGAPKQPTELSGKDGAPLPVMPSLNVTIAKE